MKAFARIIILIVIVAVIVGFIVYKLNESTETVANSSSSASALPQGLFINEVMAANKGIFPDETGEYSDWAEIYNSTDKPVSMRNYTLTDDEKQMTKWPFPDVTIKPKGYLVVFLSGKTTKDLDHGIIHSTVKLSSKGDKLILASLAGEKLDEIPKYDSMQDNVSLGRSGSEWKTFDKPTPGFENTDAGYEAFLKSMKVENSPLIISEVMTSNSMTLPDNNGAYSDWVEITNISEKDANLKGLGLTDDPKDPLKWRFPDLTLKPLENLVVFCSGNPDASAKDLKKGLHSNFRLASYKETVVLTNQRGMVLDGVNMESIPADTSYARVYEGDKPSANWKQTNQPTPAYPNTEAGFNEFQKNHQLALSDIVISEVLSANNSLDLEGDGKTYDYIEVTNRGKAAVSLKGYGLTTNAKNPAMFRFPDATINPGEHKLVLASGLKQADAEKKKYLHASFNISMQGETLALFNAQDKLIDKCILGYMPRNVSIGREEGKSTFSFFIQLTPGAANGTGLIGYAGDVAFDKPAGKYEGAIDVTLSATNGADIYYTTDGSAPTESSTKYSAPIKADKTMAIRAVALKQGYLQGKVMTETFLINQKHTLPVISLTTKPANLFDPTTGIYMEGPNASQDPAKFKEGANYYKDTEVPASFEVYDNNGKRVFNQDIALRMAGGLGLMKEQKTFAIFARSEYGQSTMQYPFFENRPYTEYKSLVLRTNRDKSKIREAVIFSLADGKIKALVQAYKPYVVYINGQYWGVYHMMEKRNKYMVAAYEGAENSDNMNILKGSGGDRNILQGSNAEYIKLREYVNTHDMSLKESFDYVAARMDTDSFMDTMINLIYTANNDFYNMQYYQILPGGKWRQIFYDTEITFQVPDHDTLSKRMGDTCNSAFFNGLLKYQPWKEKFIERFAWTIKELYSPQRVNAAIDKEANAIKDEVASMKAKFSDMASVDEWNAQIQQMHTFANKRPAKMVAQIKSILQPNEAQSKMLDDAIK